MALYKRGKTWWTDVIVNGHRYRESLGTTDGRKAPGLEQDRIAELKGRIPDPTRSSKELGTLTISDAMEFYVADRANQVSPRMVSYWREQTRPIIRSKSLGALKLKMIRPSDLALYQSERIANGRAPKTINGEISVLRQLLKRARLWFRFSDDYKPIPNTKPPIGRALTQEETTHLISVAKSRPDWIYACTASVLAFYCGMRACEIKGLKWKDVDWINSNVSIRRSKTPAGWRSPSLNQTCLEALRSLFEQATVLKATEPEHYLFPWHGKEQLIDPTKPITSWRSAWRSILKASNLQGVRFHDGRHTVVTTLAEKGVADWVIQAQVGHVDPQMMKTYSHIRRKALDEAAAALEPRKYLPAKPPAVDLPEGQLIG